MALDGIYLYSLINELKDFAINSKIDKVNHINTPIAPF